MTTIAYRDGVLAADSRMTREGGDSGSGDWVHSCNKIYRVFAGTEDVALIATAGENGPGELFVEQYSERKLVREDFADADFECLVLNREGLFLYDKWCRPTRIEQKFFAIGSGAKAALGAMYAGVSSVTAVEIACHIDPYTALPVVWAQLDDPSQK